MYFREGGAESDHILARSRFESLNRLSRGGLRRSVRDSQATFLTENSQYIHLFPIYLFVSFHLFPLDNRRRIPYFLSSLSCTEHCGTCCCSFPLAKNAALGVRLFCERAGPCIEWLLVVCLRSERDFLPG